MKKIVMGAMAAVLVLSASGMQRDLQAQDPLADALHKLDVAAAKFSGATATFEWDTYQKIVNDTDKQYGTASFKRQGASTEMRADISDTPGAKPGQIIIYTAGQLQMYEPGTEQEKIYSAGKNSGVAESFLTLGFGGSGADLKKNWNVSYQGTEPVGGVQATKLDLVPIAPAVARNVKHVTIWVDLDRGVSLKQQFFYPSGDYKLVIYTNPMLKSVPESVFKMPTNGKTHIDYVK